MARDPKQVLKNARRVSKHGTSDDPRGEDAVDKYIPYETSSHPPARVHIIRYDNTCHYPDYRYLLDIVHLEEEDGFILAFSFLMVKVTGSNLYELIEHIAQGDVTFIQKFNPRKWKRPEEGEPIIEGIEVVARNDNDEMTLDKSKKSRQTTDRNEYH